MDSEEAEILNLCARLCLSPQQRHHESDTVACYLLTNPRDSSINITGFPMNGQQYPSVQTGRGPTRNVTSAVHGHTYAVPPNSDRYVPVLTVKRPVGPTTVTAPVPLQDESGQDSYNQNGERAPQGSNAFTFGRPVPPIDCFQSRTPIAQRVRNCSRSLGTGFVHRPLTDVRTGFMRTMSKPTPGELDLKLHQERQALDKIKADLRREQAALDDPDKLDMKDIIRLVDDKNNSSYNHRSRPRAAKRRVVHASLASGATVDHRSHKEEEISDKEVKAQKAITEYKHRLHALSAQLRSGRERTQSAISRYSYASNAGDADRQSLRLSPNYNDRLMSIQLLSLPDYGGRTSPQGSVDGFSSRSYPLQSRLQTPRATAMSTLKDMTSSPGRKSRQHLYPDPIYIPSGSDDYDVSDDLDSAAQPRVKLSMRSASNVTRESSLMTDMDPRNAASVSSVQIPFPQPTIPPSNTPVSEMASDDDDSVFDDDVSLETNWASRSCSRSRSLSTSSRLSNPSTTPSESRSSRQSRRTEIRITVPSVSI